MNIIGFVIVVNGDKKTTKVVMYLSNFLAKGPMTAYPA